MGAPRKDIEPLDSTVTVALTASDLNKVSELAHLFNLPTSALIRNFIKEGIKDAQFIQKSLQLSNSLFDPLSTLEDFIKKG